MGERKGVNKYYPPDWDPSKGSINNYVGQHPLRDRARKLSQGILIIRFEMPYNIWCGGCNSHIGMGVRYNAEKTKAGMYYTTPIYKFRMKCHLCDNHFEIQTDPKNHDYVILEGARRKEQRWDPTENGQIATEDKAIQKKMVTDAMFKLEHGSDDIQKGKKAKSNIGSLELRRDEWKDDYILNKLARQKFRDEKKAIKAEVDSDNALLLKSSLDIPLQKETEEDVKLAGLIKYRALQSYDERQAEKRKEIESRPLFEPASKSTRMDMASPDNKKLDIIKKHMKTANNHSSPFDRTKMNTLGTTISKQTLGIRKKMEILPEFTNPGQNHCDEKDSLDISGNATNIDNKSCSVDEISGYTKSKQNRTDQWDQINVDVQNSSVHLKSGQGNEYLTFTLCSRSLRQNEEDEIVLNCECKNKQEITTEKQDVQTRTCETEENSLKLANDKQRISSLSTGEITCNSYKCGNGRNLQNSSNEGNFTKSALGLVCEYSDTDSES